MMILLGSLAAGNNNTIPCSLCPNNGIPAYPNKLITFRGWNSMECASIHKVMPMAITDSSSVECKMTNHLASLCGCERPRDACNLCWDGSPAAHGDRPSPDFYDFMGLGTTQGEPPSCFLIEAHLHSISENTTECRRAQQTVGNHCGCCDYDLKKQHSIFKNFSIPPFLEHNDNHRHHYYQEHGTISAAATAATIVNSSLSISSPHSGEEEKEEYCKHQNDNIFGNNGDGNKEQERATGSRHNNTSNQTIIPSIDVGFLFIKSYSGAANEAEQMVQHQVACASSIMSAISAFFVILDNICHRRRLGRNMYNQIIFAMAFFDVIFSVASAFLTLPVPRDNMGIFTWGAMGTEASCKVQGWALQFGCLTSLFFNASLTTYYWLVIVKSAREGTLRQLRKWLLGLPLVLGGIFAFASIPFISPSLLGCHLVPPSTAFRKEIQQAMGFAPTWRPFLGLFILPGYLVVAYSTVMLVRIFLYIRHVDEKSKQWSFRRQGLKKKTTNGGTAMRGGGRTRRRASWIQTAFFKNDKTKRRETLKQLQYQVFWQSILYIFALYTTLVVFLCFAMTVGEHVGKSYNLWTVVFFLLPLQGLLNAFVYFRPRLWRQCRKCLENRDDELLDALVNHREPSQNVIEINGTLRLGGKDNRKRRGSRDSYDIEGRLEGEQYEQFATKNHYLEDDMHFIDSTRRHSHRDESNIARNHGQLLRGESKEEWL